MFIKCDGMIENVLNKYLKTICGTVVLGALSVTLLLL